MTNNARPRLLTPPEIELWELARKADASHDCDCHLNDFCHECACDPFIDRHSPDKAIALLETLEKTRGALRDVNEHLTYIYAAVNLEREENYALEAGLNAKTLLARALLSGFSGDAAKEERGG